MDATLLEHFMPRYDVRSHHEMQVKASPERVYAAIMDANFGESPVVRTLFALRGLPARLSGKRAPRGLGLSMRKLTESGFALLGERPGEEVVFGLVGRFWKLAGDLQRIDAERFLPLDDASFAKATWQFAVAARAGGSTLLTETRVLCLGEDARRKFLRYWMVIGPFSSLIRGEILRIIRRTAER